MSIQFSNDESPRRWRNTGKGNEMKQKQAIEKNKSPYRGEYMKVYDNEGYRLVAGDGTWVAMPYGHPEGETMNIHRDAVEKCRLLGYIPRDLDPNYDRGLLCSALWHAPPVA